MSPRILLIEDNPANLELMRYLLQAFGHETVTAIDGSSGVAMARSMEPDLIVCDVQLPGMDGLAVAAALKADPRMRQVPLVAVTAFAMVGDRERVLAAGFDGYISKPISPEQFPGEIMRYLESGVSPNANPVIDSSGEDPAYREPRGATSTATILVVDHHPVNLDLARAILEPSGYRVVAARNMTDALLLTREVECDLILSDVVMSGGSGLDFLRAVKADPDLQDITFVFLSSSLQSPPEIARGLELGADQYLLRPIEPMKLLQVIADCLG